MQIYWSWKLLCENRPKTFWGWRGKVISWGFGNSTIYLRFVSKENLEGYLIIEMKIVHLLPPLVSHQIRYDSTATSFTKGGKTWSKFWNPSKFSLETNLRYLVLFPKPQDIAQPLQPKNIFGPFFTNMYLKLRNMVIASQF